MISIIKSRLKQGYRTMDYPNGPLPELPARYIGKPLIKSGKCTKGCNACVDVCPTDAITITNDSPVIDMGLCIFCKECENVCPVDKIEFSREFAMASVSRENLIIGEDAKETGIVPDNAIKRIFGRSLKLREVCAGGCGACEADTNVLGTIGWDLGRFGIQFVASPRHADGLLVTGPVTKNMETALRKTYDAIPEPKIVIAVGACAISGGLFEENDETYKGVADILPVDMFIPGCPPNPATILNGLLQLIGKINS